MSRIKFSFFAAAFAAIALAAAPASAAVWPGEWFVSGGYGSFFGDTSVTIPIVESQYSGYSQPQPVSEKLSGSSMITGQFIYQFTPHVGLGLEYIGRSVKGETSSSIGSMGNQNLPSSINHEIFLATARYVFMPERIWNPYVVGGVGLDRMSSSAQVYTYAPFAPYYYGPFSDVVTANLLAGSAGFGIERSLSGNLFADVEFGVVGVRSYSITSGFNQINLSNELMPYLTARLGFDFGGTGR